MPNHFSITWSGTRHRITVGAGVLFSSPTAFSQVAEQTLVLPPNTSGAVYLVPDISGGAAAHYTDDSLFTPQTVPPNGISLGRYTSGPTGVTSFTQIDQASLLSSMLGQQVVVVPGTSNLATVSTFVSIVIVTGTDGNGGAGIYRQGVANDVGDNPSGTGFVSASGLTYWFPISLSSPATATRIATKSYVDTTVTASKPFAITASGLTATVGPGSVMDAVGTALSYTGGSIGLLASYTHYLYLDMFDLTVQVLSRKMHRGGIYIGCITTNSTVATSITQPTSFNIPKTRIPITKQRIASGQKWSALVIANSIGDGGRAASPSTQSYPNLLFNSSTSASGYNVNNISALTYQIYAVPGAHTQFAMLCGANIVEQPTLTQTRPGTAFHRLPYGNLRAPDFKQKVGKNWLLKTPPTLAIFNLTVNDGDVDDNWRQLECGIRAFRKAGCEVILITDNKRFSGASMSDVTAKLDCLASATGSELADTYAFIQPAHDAYVANGGTDVYYDYIGDQVHPNAAGHGLYARAIRGIMNNFVQEADVRLSACPEFGYTSASSNNEAFVSADLELVPNSLATATASLTSGAVNAVAVSSVGVGYTGVPTVSFFGGGGSSATATAALAAVAARIPTGQGGSGYAVNDVLIVSGDTGTAATFTVTAVASGAVVSVSLTTGGSQTALASGDPAVWRSTTGGTGTGAKLFVQYGLGSVTVTAGGTGYTSAPAVGIMGNQTSGLSQFFAGGFSGATPSGSPNGTFSTYNPAVNLAGIPPAQAVYNLTQNDWVAFGHGSCNSIYMLTDLPLGASATIEVHFAGSTIKTISWNGSGASNGQAYGQIITLLSFSDLVSNVPGWCPSNNRQALFQCSGFVKCTALSGTNGLPIVGFLFLTHDSREIPFEAMRLGGTWAVESAYFDNASILYTDTPGSDIIIPFAGDYLEVFLGIGASSGTSTAKIDAWVDGEQIESGRLLNPFGTSRYVYHLCLQPGNGSLANSSLGFPGPHAARIRLAVPESSPSAQARSLAVLAARDVYVR